MSYNLFLDDERKPSDVSWTAIGLGPWVVVRDYDQFIHTIMQEGVPDKVSFDHDLAEEHYHAMMSGSSNYGKIPTGYDCAVWLIDYCYRNAQPFPQYTVHSLNPDGREKIIMAIRMAKSTGYIK